MESNYFKISINVNRFIIFLVFCVTISLSNKAASKSDSPYSVLANYLLRNDRKSKEFIKYTQKEVESAIKRLSDGQKAVKSMDGAAHMFNSAISEKRSLLV